MLSQGSSAKLRNHRFSGKQEALTRKRWREKRGVVLQQLGNRAGAEDRGSCSSEVQGASVPSRRALPDHRHPTWCAMSGWAPVRARKVVAAMRLERWSQESPCPETLADAQLSCLLEVEELAEWSATKLGKHWGWGRKMATRLLVEWADWFETQGPASRRMLPSWVTEITTRRHRKSTGREQPEHEEGTVDVEEDQGVAEVRERRENRRGAGEAPRAGSSQLDTNQTQPETKIGSNFEKPDVVPLGEGEEPVITVYRTWEERYRDFRNRRAKRQQEKPYAATRPRLQAVRRALRAVDPETGKPYRPEALILLIRYAFEAQQGAPDVDWWRKDRGRYLGLENLMVTEKLPARLQVARDWEAGDIEPASQESARRPSGDRSSRGAFPTGAGNTSGPSIEPVPIATSVQQQAFERRRLQLKKACEGA